MSVQESVEEQAQNISAEDENVRTKIRDMTLGLITLEKEGLEKFLSSVEEIISGGVKGAKNLVEERQTKVLGEVVSGISDALESSANAARLTAEEMSAEGKEYSKKEIGRIRESLEEINDKFFSSVESSLKAAESEFSWGYERLEEHLKRTYEHIKPALGDAIGALRKEPLTSMKEAVEISGAVSAAAVGAFFQAMGGVLDAAQQTLKQHDSKDDASAETDKPGTAEKQEGKPH